VAHKAACCYGIDRAASDERERKRERERERDFCINYQAMATRAFARPRPRPAQSRLGPTRSSNRVISSIRADNNNKNRMNWNRKARA